MATDLVVTDSVHIGSENLKCDASACEHEWSDWIRAKGGYMRRRRRILGQNDHWGSWSWDQTWNQRFRLNPTSHGTQVETAKEEFEFRWRRRVWKRKRMLIRPDTEQRQTDEESDKCSKQETFKAKSDRRDDQDSTIIYGSDDNAVSHPEEREVDLERGVTEAEHDGRDYEGSIVVPSDHDPMHSNVTPDPQKIDQKIGVAGFAAEPSPHVNYWGKPAKSVSSAIASIKSALTSIPGKSATASTLSAGHAVTANAANETSNTIAAWIFGTATVGVAGVTAHATRKTADASIRSAHAGEVSARASMRSAMAAEESARAGTRSALAAENSVSLIKSSWTWINTSVGPLSQTEAVLRRSL